MTQVVRSFYSQLYFPERIFFGCLFFAVVSLAWNGSFYDLYLLINAQKKLESQTQELKVQGRDYDKKLNQAKDLQFITHEAMDRYEMVGADDLVFVFPND